MPKICYDAASESTLFIRTRNEHCDAHIHAFNTSDNWEIKVYFSYAANDPVHNKFEIIAGVPKMGQINAVIQATNTHLAQCREDWWKVLSCICLKNQPVSIAANGVLRREPKGATNVLVVQRARYIAGTNTVEFKAVGSNTVHVGSCP